MPGCYSRDLVKATRDPTSFARFRDSGHYVLGGVFF